MAQDGFSKRLKELMELEDLSNRALALQINVDRASIRLWLHGSYYPKYDALIKLATFFKIKIDNLLGLENQSKDVAELPLVEGEFCQDVQKQFFEQLTAYMKKERLSCYAVAKKVRIDQKAFTNWLKKGSMPETEKLINLSRAMGVSVDELLGRKV